MSRPALCILIVLGLVAGPGLADGFLTPLGSIAADQRTHLIRVTAITMIAVAPVLIGVPWLLWRYRRGRKGPYRPHFEFSVPLEFVMWGVPTLIIIVLGYWLWKATIQLDPLTPAVPIRWRSRLSVSTGSGFSSIPGSMWRASAHWSYRWTSRSSCG